ncbi:MAG: LysM domain-containing protein, partial [Steroidobacteraceae bacterium]
MGPALARSCLLAAALALVACSGGARRPAIPDHHVVRAGETLYSISMRYGLDYHDVARWNRIGRSYRIYPGQRIRLDPPPGTQQRSAPPVPPPAPRASPDDPAHRPPRW